MGSAGFAGSAGRGIHFRPSRGLKRNTEGLERGGVFFRIASTRGPQNPHNLVVREVVRERPRLEGGFAGTGSEP